MQLSEADHARVSAAIAAAESTSDGEIVAVATPLSDSYHDVALHWALLVLIGTLAIFAAWPPLLHFWFDLFFGGWRPEPSLRELLTLLMVLAVAKFTAVLLILRYMPLRLALTPSATKARRVRRRAIEIFKAAAERRTEGRTGILIYLSMGEHRAEIVADQAITRVTSPETWGEAMEALLVDVKAGRIADGIIAAIEEVGLVLAEHVPKSAGNPNEIPDKLIEL
ncbi:MAG: TPM domain-containing protein [Sphingomicrobium sp.]